MTVRAGSPTARAWLRASWPNHVWSYDFVEARTHEVQGWRVSASPITDRGAIHVKKRALY
jgi:hypothetical protein